MQESIYCREIDGHKCELYYDKEKELIQGFVEGQAYLDEGIKVLECYIRDNLLLDCLIETAYQNYELDSYLGDVSFE